METILSNWPLQLAIVLQPDIGRALQPFGGEFVLGRRDGEAGDMMIVGRGAFGKTAPAAADLQHRGFRLVEFGQDALIFVLLGVGRARRRRHTAPRNRSCCGPATANRNRCRRRNASLMLRDEPAMELRRTSALWITKPRRLRKLPSREILEMIQVEQEQADQLLDIVGVPAAGDIFLAQADIAARHDPAQHIPVMDLKAASGPGWRAPAPDVTSPLGAMNSSVPIFQRADRLAPAFLDIRSGYQGHALLPSTD